jgi:hypothetical protein
VGVVVDVVAAEMLNDVTVSDEELKARRVRAAGLWTESASRATGPTVER